MDKVVSMKDIEKFFFDGMTIMFGGFMCNGQALDVIEMILEKGIKDITLICNDTGYPDKGVGKLVSQGRVKKAIASHVGLNPVTGQKMADGSMEVELVPQGTLAERVRADGAGLGGVLTPTGVGTIVQDGKEVININGKDYLLELPLHADVALVKGNLADKSGNVIYLGTTRNFNPLIATAADVVIVEADKIVEVGELDPNYVHTPNVLVDYVVKGGTL